MSYMHIENLYKDTRILDFKWCYALEKIHGSSAHVMWKDGALHFFAGGCKHEHFVALFEQERLAAAFVQMGHPQVVVYGEAYGGKMQHMSETYGPDLRFVAFEVKIGDAWLDVLNAQNVALSLGFEFVHYTKEYTDMDCLDRAMLLPSVQAQRNGMGSDRKREGIVLRPPFEVTLNNGQRLIAKYKNDDFNETKTPRVVGDKLVVLQEAQAVADEWVTEMRLSHVLDGFPDADITQTGKVIGAMVEDIGRESMGEIAGSREVRTAIGKRTAQMFKARLQDTLRKESSK